MDDLDLPLEVIAQRTVDLVVAAETSGYNSLRYVVGSEVPTPGGGQSGELPCQPTTVQSAQQTLEIMRLAFRERSAEVAWERAIALVVQPGIEFDSQSVHVYDPLQARGLVRWIEAVPGLIFEAHSTDYQSPATLRQLVADHFAILKVGPALTFAYRQAVFALAQIEAELGFDNPSQLKETLEAVMLADPTHWQKHYTGSPQELRIARQYSLSDRIRYYWNVPAVQQALGRLVINFGDNPIPLPLLSQYLPRQAEAIRDGRLDNSLNELIHFAIATVMENYWQACFRN
jgi:D-tagatose-1,6-bisphosphate aldolase subunit GatZ/KbaZ